MYVKWLDRIIEYANISMREVAINIEQEWFVFILLELYKGIVLG